MLYSKINIGHSAGGKDIFAYINQKAAPKYTYLMAGVHGDEPEGVYVLKKLFDWLLTQEITRPIIVIPVLNPDGLEINKRVNYNGVDLNRNWPTSDWTKSHKEGRYYPGELPLSEPENEGLSVLFVKYKPEIIISFHSWQPMLDCNQKARAVAEYIVQYNHYSIASVGYPTPGSLGTYAEEFLQCGIITYELPVQSSKNNLEQIWQANAKGLQHYFLDFK